MAAARRLPIRVPGGTRVRAAVLVALALIVIAGAVLVVKWRSISSRLFGSNFVGGAAGITQLHLPSGFSMSVYATGLHAPRFMTVGPDGAIYVAESGAGDVVRLGPPETAGQPAPATVVVRGLDNPTSLAFAADGALYIGEESRVTLVRFDAHGAISSRTAIIPLPSGGNHVTRTVLLGPERQLYISIGSTCNNCFETDPHRATVWVWNADGSGGRRYVSGMRNAVGMAINPWNGQIWVTDMGRDYLGDNSPPDTIYALRDGGNYGWPTCDAGTIVDPDTGHPGACNGVVQPLVDIQAHSAPLGLAFYDSGPFPGAWHGLFVADHGSWNRSVPTGYKVVFIPLDAHGNVAGPVRDFATGWLRGSSASGRPVGVIVGPDGALYISDDKAGMVYRIAYTR